MYINNLYGETNEDKNMENYQNSMLLHGCSTNDKRNRKIIKTEVVGKQMGICENK